ncbi:MAG: arginine--tRNA ligase [Pseudomonadota bacterium]
MSLREALSAAVGDAFEAEGLPRNLGAVQTADRPDLAQFQCNGAMPAAKIAKRKPRDIAEGVAARLRAHADFASVEPAGPGFLNITLADAALETALKAAVADPKLGGWTKPEERIILDYGGPNVAKPLHVGHLRAAIIGESLKRLFRFVGDEVIGDIHLGDWGLPMGMLIADLKRTQPALPYFSDDKPDGPFPDVSPVSLSDLEEMYPRAAAACKADPDRMEEARRATAELHAGHAGYRALWKGFLAVSREAIEREYGDLGVSFDLWKGESDVDDLIDPMQSELRAAGVAEESDGALIIKVAQEGDAKETPPLILLKSDGSALYGTTDLATILDRRRAYDPKRILYVVDQRQSLHFEQVFRAAERAGYFDGDRLEHIGFGTMNGPDGKPFKTREGGVLKLRDLIDMVRGRAADRMAEAGVAEGYGAEETAAIAHHVGVAALKFADLSNVRTSNYVFDLDRFVSFEGKTGPYLQYACVRLRSVLRKAAAERGETPDASRLQVESDAVRALVLAALRWPDVIAAAYAKRTPHLLCDFLFDLAQAVSGFYAVHKIVGEPDADLRASRLALADFAARLLAEGLFLLGIEAPDRM